MPEAEEGWSPGDPGTLTAACHRVPCLCGWPVAPCQFRCWKELEPVRPVRPRAGSLACCLLSFTLPWQWQCSLKVGGMKAWLSYSFSFKSFLRRPGFCTSSVPKLTLQPSSVSHPSWHQQPYMFLCDTNFENVGICITAVTHQFL